MKSHGWCLIMVVAMSVVAVRSDVKFIEETCKKTKKPDLCVSLLKSDPRGSSADTTGLALILVDHMKTTATKTMGEIRRLQKKRPGLRKPLASCADYYKTILEADIPMAVEALSKGVPKYAENGVADAAIEASSCEGAFKGKSPLTALTKSMQDISDVARVFVRMLL